MSEIPAIQFVYVRGGDKTAPVIAAAAGIPSGIRHDYKAYADVFMLDIKWDDYDWSEYLELVRQYQPIMALAPDYERPDQYETLMQQIADLRPLVPVVLVCPKFNGAIAHIPADCRVAISVPAPKYAGFLPADFSELSGREIHLLGGKPETQMDLITKFHAVGASVKSADGSYLAMKAARGQYFEAGKWIDVRGKGIPTVELSIMSARNIPRYLNAAIGHKQPALF